MNTTDRAGFLAAILANPADDMARGAYADWLRDGDDAFDKMHGRFLWAGMTLWKFRGLEPVGDGMFFDAIAEQSESAARVLAVQVKALMNWSWDRCAWENEAAAPDRVTVGAIQPPVEGETRQQRRDRRRAGGVNPAVIWERGCVAGLRLTLRRAWEVLPYVLAQCPVEWVEVIDVPGLTLKIGPEQWGRWRLTGELNFPPVLGRSGAVLGLPPLVLSEPWGMSSRGGLLECIRVAVSDTVDLLRSESGDRWPAPSLLVGPIWG